MSIRRLRWVASSIFLIIEFSHKVDDAVSDHFVAFLKIICDTKMRAASTTPKNVIEVVRQDDKYDS